LIGTIDDPETRFILEPANDDDEVVSEVVVVKAVLNTAARTTVMLDKPLGHVYDRTTVAVYGNVVHASHGRTVTNELLGSSDSMGVNQRFLLSQPPLTYLPDNTPEGAASTLAIEVNGVRWEEVPDLHTYTRDQRVYMVRQHAPSGTPLEDGSSGTDQTKPSYPTMEVIFGNSTNGAGLPAGTWKIEASYRTGIGSAGNVPAGTLSVMQTALRDIKGVSNPIPGSGGANPETMHNAREAAPLTARALSRIVSLSDFEDFARAFAGIGRAEARLLSYGVRRLLHITVAGADGAVMGKDSDLLRSLSLAIRQSRAAPEPPVYIDCFAPLYFNVAARVLIDPAHQARKPIIEAAIRQALIQAFSFAGRAFGQPLVQAEVINVIQNVRGVVALDLSHLYVQGQPAALHQQLNAQPARVERNTLLPAQMLLINTRGSEGITLEIAP
jgi:predicted phage baseplate assembly protein